VSSADGGWVGSGSRASLQFRAASEAFSRRSDDFGSVASSGLDCSSLSRLGNVDAVVRYASQNALDRDGFGEARSNFAESYCASSSDPGRTPRASSTTVGGSELNGSGPSYAPAAGREPSRLDEEERRLSEFSKIEDNIRTTLPAVDRELDAVSATCTVLSSASDLETLDRLDGQFAEVEAQLARLTAVFGDVLEVATSVDVAKPTQEKVCSSHSVRKFSDSTAVRSH